VSGFDHTYRNAIHSAFEAFRPHANHFRKATQQRSLQPLLDYLRSDAEFGAAEREELALLLAGEYGRRRGRPAHSLQQHSRRLEICREVFEVEAQWAAEGQRRPFREKSLKVVAANIRKRAASKTDNVTAEQIDGWLKGLTRNQRASLQDKSGIKSDQIKS
jgi:hypothetical protein